MGIVTFLKNDNSLIFMIKSECLVRYYFLVRTTSTLYFHDAKVKTILVLIFNKIKFCKLSKFAYIGCLRIVEVHQMLKNVTFGHFWIKIFKKWQQHIA